MSNWIDYQLDVMAGSPAEMNQVAERLNQPSQELTIWVAEKFGQSVNEVAAGLKDLLKFEVVRNLGCVSDEINKARRFRLTFKDRSHGIVDSHLAEVSEDFPTAIFLLEYYDLQYSYAGKSVIKAGELVQGIHDGDQHAQAMEWVLVDIFAPFRAEYELGVEFGSLWQEWLADLTIAIQNLRGERTRESL